MKKKKKRDEDLHKCKYSLLLARVSYIGLRKYMQRRNTEALTSIAAVKLQLSLFNNAVSF